MRSAFTWLVAVSCIVACSPECVEREDLLASGAGGRSVVAKYDCSTHESIEMKSASGNKTTIFAYESSGGVSGCKGQDFGGATAETPVVTWNDPHVIHISIGLIYSIEEKLDEVDGVHITYDIGTILEEACADAAP